MTPGARLAAAAEILAEIIARKAAADRTISGWGKAHRFAGSKDRAAIGGLSLTIERVLWSVCVGLSRPHATRASARARRRICV